MMHLWCSIEFVLQTNMIRRPLYSHMCQPRKAVMIPRVDCLCDLDDAKKLDRVEYAKREEYAKRVRVSLVATPPTPAVGNESGERLAESRAACNAAQKEKLH
eukprot:PhM_4_TR6338/c0_g1_i2/m.52526